MNNFNYSFITLTESKAGKPNIFPSSQMLSWKEEPC